MMRNIIIIGPPASGKLTIATAVANAKGYFLFDNHRSIDATTFLRANQSVQFKGLRDVIRKSVMQAAARTDIPIIFTMKYGHPIDDRILGEHIDAMTTREPPFVVQLHCSRQDAMKRCQDSSRVNTSKVKDPRQLEELHKKYDMETSYTQSDVEVLHIDTSNVTVDEAVERIIENLNSG